MDEKRVKPAVPTKKLSKKKPKDRPKRPLSAYNFFFKEERERILRVVNGEEPDDEDPDQPKVDVSKIKLERGRVSFEEMGKLIGHRWKTISAEKLQKFTDMATEDTNRYKKEMVEYNAKQEERIRAEAVVQRQSPVWSSSSYVPGPVPGSMGSGYSAGPYQYGSSSGYGESSSSFAMYGQYGGYPMSEYGQSSYGMPQSAYGYPSQYSSPYASSSHYSGYGQPYPQQYFAQGSADTSSPQGYYGPQGSSPASDPGSPYRAYSYSSMGGYYGTGGSSPPPAYPTTFPSAGGDHSHLSFPQTYPIQTYSSRRDHHDEEDDQDDTSPGKYDSSA